MVPLVPRPARLEALFLDDRERFGQRVDERGRHRVVILPAAASSPRAAADRSRSCGTCTRRSSARGPKTTGASPDGRAQALLRAAVARVDAPAADVERMAAERRDRVDDDERAVLARDRRQRLRPDSARRSTFPRAPSRRRRRAWQSSARRSASGSHARPHSTSSRVTVAPYRSHICASRSPK